jgi:hypothetical protein
MNEKFGVHLIGTVNFGYIAGIRYCLNTVETNKFTFQEGPFALWRKLIIRTSPSRTFGESQPLIEIKLSSY